MKGFKGATSTQRFLSSLEQILNLLKVGCYKNSAPEYRKKLKEGLTIFDGIVNSHYQST